MRQASFRASSLENAQPGQAVKVPVYLQVEEGGSLSGLQFLAKITPSQSAPTIAAPAVFVPDVTASGRPVDGLAPNQVAYAWDLGAFDPPLRGRALLGHVVFTVPATALSGQTYQVRFANADGAPDESTQYEFETFSARVSVNAPAGIEDRISDEWKTEFFGNAEASNAAPSADPDQDGLPNWKEYLAGTDPTDAASHLRLRAPVQSSKDGKKQVTLRWLTAPGKKYIVESATDVIRGPWTVITGDVAGDGYVREHLDSNLVEATQYYRVRLQD